jgi:hypothetical protein
MTRQTRASTSRRYVSITERENAEIAVIPREQRGDGPRVKAPAPPPPSDLVAQVQAARRAERKRLVKAGRNQRR